MRLMNRVCGVLAFLLVAFSVRAAEMPGCAVMTFEAKNGVSKEESSVLADGLESELIQLKQYRMVSRANLAKVLEAQKISMECSGTECAIEAGKIAALRYVVFGSIGKVGETYSLVVNMADTETGVIEKTAKVMQSGKIDQVLVVGVEQAARKLMGFGPVAPVTLESPSSFSEYKLGDVLSLDLGGGEKMDVVWIPAGTFMMGSTPEQREWAAGPEGKGKAEWFADEGDRPRETRISNGFWLGRTEVTVGQWKRFVLANADYQTDAIKQGQAWLVSDKGWAWGKGNSWRDPGFEQRDDHPVVCMSWNDAKAFCAWLNRDYASRLPAGLTFRLPGEAEWEYACRGGRSDSAKFWWGDRLEDGKSRLNGASPDAFPNGCKWTDSYAWNDGYALTAPVDHYVSTGRNGYGLADMLGNVWEWCEDTYANESASATIRTDEGEVRVLRGGSYFNVPSGFRCADRAGSPATAPDANYGFRVFAGSPIK